MIIRIVTVLGLDLSHFEFLSCHNLSFWVVTIWVLSFYQLNFFVVKEGFFLLLSKTCVGWKKYFYALKGLWWGFLLVAKIHFLVKFFFVCVKKRRRKVGEKKLLKKSFFGKTNFYFFLNCQWNTIIVKLFFCQTSCLVKILFGKKKVFGEILFWWIEVFGHYCHYCLYFHYCHYCHYYHICRIEGMYMLPFDTLKVTFSQRSTNRPTDRQTDR